MRVHVIQHVPFEGPAAIAEWADERGVRLTNTKVFTGEPFPRSGDAELLVVMGGPMSANDVDDLPWLAEEKATIGEFIRAGKRVLGICLGAQLIADVLGQKVYRASEKEIGWFPVSLAPNARTSPLFADFPDRFVPLHWHGETFDLPPHADLIASSAAVPNQAFVVDGRVVGLQFHLEATPSSIDELIECAASDITGGTWQQSADEISSSAAAHVGALRPLLFSLLDRLCVNEQSVSAPTDNLQK